MHSCIQGIHLVIPIAVFTGLLFEHFHKSRGTCDDCHTFNMRTICSVCHSSGLTTRMNDLEWEKRLLLANVRAFSSDLTLAASTFFPISFSFCFFFHLLVLGFCKVLCTNNNDIEVHGNGLQKELHRYFFLSLALSVSATSVAHFKWLPFGSFSMCSNDYF